MAKETAEKPRKETVGKRRGAREIAIQMLYQRELGGSSLADIFAAFDLADYAHQTRRTAPPVDVDEGESPAEDLAPDDVEEEPPTEAELRQMKDSFSYAQKLLAGVDENSEEIDERIRQHAENWRLERMPVIDRSILRLAVYEMLFESSIPKIVIVDEAIELAKKFGSENSGRFVNGLLDGVLKAEAEAGGTEAGETEAGGTAGEMASAHRSDGSA